MNKLNRLGVWLTGFMVLTGVDLIIRPDIHNSVGFILFMLVSGVCILHGE
jgi:hypothetical protein